jgi:putative membrane protein
MRKQLKQFLVRWAVCAAGLGIAAYLFSTVELDGNVPTAVIVAGLILALVNVILKPLVTLLSLPAIMLSFGLFTILINGLMVTVSSWIYAPLDVETFGAAVLTGGIIGVLNFVITRIVDQNKERRVYE